MVCLVSCDSLSARSGGGGEGGVHGSPKVTAVWYDTRCDKALGPSERWILTPTGSLRLPRALGVAGT